MRKLIDGFFLMFEGFLFCESIKMEIELMLVSKHFEEL